ncbi:MAG: hypothetical protein QOC83_5498 [Pseudonocardiales bacterium]|nr:hypothetical protein [Pseudonocardiales bacterium]
MPRLVLGPMQRHVDHTSAAIWVETDAPCTVEVLDTKATTFTVHGHHYALVELSGLAPGAVLPYTVRLDGEQVWPEPDSPYPPSRIRTIDPAGRVRLVFGSCRTSVAHDAATTLVHGVDVLRCHAHRLRDADERDWPTALLLLGDQVYADEPPEAVLEYIRARRDTNQPPGEETADFSEYAELYRHAWSDPELRWLLSTVPTFMIFDDHDLRDDWNTSQTWREQMARQPWWRGRVAAGLGAYWIYQHLGNLSPDQRATDPLLTALRKADGDGDGDGWRVLEEFAARADQDPAANRWSYHLDFGHTRLVMLDSRCGRVLTPGRRTILDDVEWEWLRGLAAGEHRHLVIGTSLPYLLPVGVHYLESWNEAVCDGAWGARAARVGERIRQAVDLEHWAAFGRSFTAMAQLITDLCEGRLGTPPASIGFLSGDVHFSYLARLDPAPTGSTAVYQAVCSPIRNPLPRPIRLLNGVASFGAAGAVGRALASLARVPRAPLRWRLQDGPHFQNALGTLDLHSDRVEISWDAPGTSDADPPPLRQLTHRHIA